MSRCVACNNAMSYKELVRKVPTAGEEVVYETLCTRCLEGAGVLDGEFELEETLDEFLTKGED